MSQYGRGSECCPRRSRPDCAWNDIWTQCKPGKMGAGLSFLKEVCRAAHTVNPTVKVFAIGGIKPDNIKKVLESGADGGCMMSWFMQQD